ncbi:MAG: TRAP transporter small permease subunit [Deltaproteobacteria bacterium]|nr:TRAP transporter small permease subunit [Deltaproteobacteria bacterium]MBW2120228.1 TRAP transporter small permease subunit [Deltaproteobacteria bacterium]
MSGFARIAGGIDKVNSFLGQVAYVLIALQAGFVVVAIFRRYVLNNPFKAATEIGQIAMVFVSMLGAAYVLKIGGHIHVEVFVVRLKPRIRDFIMGLNYIVFGIPYCAAITYYCFLFVQSSYTIKEHSQGAFILLWPIKSVCVLGFILLGLQFLISGVRLIQLSLGASCTQGVSHA